MKDRERISKAKWSSLGGLRNSRLFRVQSRNGTWRYFISI